MPNIYGLRRRGLADLAACARVSRAWFDNSMPILWQHRQREAAKGVYELIEDTMRPIEPHRRQLYADHLEQGYMLFPGVASGTTIRRQGPRSEADEAMLRELVFPRLVHVCLEGDQNPWQLPERPTLPLRAPNLLGMHIIMSFDYGGVANHFNQTRMGIWHSFFETVPVS